MNTLDPINKTTENNKTIENGVTLFDTYSKFTSILDKLLVPRKLCENRNEYKVSVSSLLIALNLVLKARWGATFFLVTNVIAKNKKIKNNNNNNKNKRK